MKQLLFIGHTYHQITKSHTFVLDLLSEEYELSTCYLDPAQPFGYQELDALKGKAFDALVVWQVMPKVAALKQYVSWQTAAFFPMYDHYDAHGRLFLDEWEDYQDFIIICFSHTLHQELRANGFDTRYLQFFPQPRQVTEWGDEQSVFFWQRLSFLNLSTLAKAMEGFGLQEVHLHQAPDPGHQIRTAAAFGHPTAQFYEQVKFSESTWFESKDLLLKEMDRHALYMAPRHSEGIGMSFLEAMASGRVVIAPDTPTMNEYIQDGVNGLLYPWDEQNPSHCSQAVKRPQLTIREIQQNAFKTISDGYVRWNQEKSQIASWVGLRACPDLQKLQRCAILHGRRDWPLEEQPRPDGTLLAQKSIVKAPLLPTDTAPVVSVVTVVFNAIDDGRKEMFLQCLDSVQQQQGIAIEHIIVDGCSTDGTLELVKSYQNRHIPIRLLSMKDQGIYDAMNRGLYLAKGTYITYLNSDDFYHAPSGLADSVAMLRETGCTFSFAPVTIIDDIHPHNPHAFPYLYIQEVFQHAVFSHQSILVDRQLMLDMHGFDLSYRSAADYDFVLRLLLTGQKGCYVNTNFVCYRMTGVSSTNPQRSSRETGIVFWRLYNKYLHAHLTKEEAYQLHMTWKIPLHAAHLKKTFTNMADKAFVGLPQEVYHQSSTVTEVLFSLRCLCKGRLKTLRDFLLVNGNSRFNRRWYAIRYHSEIMEKGLPPAAHYLLSGWTKGNDPSPRFSTHDYLRRYPDVAAMNICPLIHWKLKGKREGRQC